MALLWISRMECPSEASTPSSRACITKQKSAFHEAADIFSDLSGKALLHGMMDDCRTLEKSLQPHNLRVYEGIEVECKQT